MQNERNIFTHLLDRLKRPSKPDYELRTDEQSWTDMVRRRLGEAISNGIPARFLYTRRSAPDQGYYLTISEKDPFTIVFIHTYIEDGFSNEFAQAIVLQTGQQPRYLYEYDISDEEKEWQLSPRGEDLDQIGYCFHRLRKSTLFDSRKTSLSWQGQYPDEEGALERLSED